MEVGAAAFLVEGFLAAGFLAAFLGAALIAAFLGDAFFVGFLLGMLCFVFVVTVGAGCRNRTYARPSSRAHGL